jgi:tetratricopeptide (TPR) repeat protein
MSKRMMVAALVLGMAGGLMADESAVGASATAKDAVKAAPVSATAAAKPDMKSAKKLLDEGKFDEAAQAYQAIGTLGTKKGEGWRLNNLGLAYIKMNKPADAVKPLEQAVAVDPKNATAWNNLGVAYENTEQADKALDAYRKALEAAKQGDQPSNKVSMNLRKLEIRQGVTPTAEDVSGTAKGASGTAQAE